MQHHNNYKWQFLFIVHVLSFLLSNQVIAMKNGLHIFQRNCIATNNPYMLVQANETTKKRKYHNNQHLLDP